jgi:hypothetical protein
LYLNNFSILTSNNFAGLKARLKDVITVKIKYQSTSSATESAWREKELADLDMIYFCSLFSILILNSA